MQTNELRQTLRELNETAIRTHTVTSCKSNGGNNYTETEDVIKQEISDSECQKIMQGAAKGK